MKKGKNIKVGIVIALLLLVVGFAAVTTTLNVLGITSLKGNNDDFEKSIRFVSENDAENPATIVSSMDNKSGSVEVSADGKTLMFTTPVLDTVDETATISYYVENVGSYDAELGKITCKATVDNEELLDYIEITASENYNGTELLAGNRTTEAATIIVKQTKTYASDETAEITISCALPAAAIQK